VLSVAAYAPPAIGQINLAGGNLVISGSGGIAGWNYYLLAATNLAAAWTPLATNQFDANGNFLLTNAVNPAAPQVFYKLQLQ
jgi:hypothetical protein